MLKRITSTILALLFCLSLGAAIPAAASPLCNVGQVCGKITIEKSSDSDCYVLIDGDWSNGATGYHPKMWDRDGYRKSTRWFKDTDGFYSACKVKDVNGNKTYAQRTWIKIRDYQHLSLKVWH